MSRLASPTGANQGGAGDRRELGRNWLSWPKEVRSAKSRTATDYRYFLREPN
jgi:hypothetical protein